MSRTMNIMFLIPSLESGGAERQLVLLVNELSSRGHTVRVALFRASGPLLADLNPSVQVVDLEKGGKADIFGFMARAIRVVRRIRPDVLCSFLGVPNIVATALKACFPSMPVVWSVRSSDVDLKQYGYFARLCSKVEIFLSRFADRIVFNSSSGLDYGASKGMAAAKAEVVFNGIDTDAFFMNRPVGADLRDKWLGDGEFLIGIVARLDPMKDHETFLRAVSIVSKTDIRYRFVCVGEGPLEAELAKSSAELGVDDVLTWAGRRSDMMRVYNSLDLCVLSSISEGFPNVLGEAMACGVPCVTTDVGDAFQIVGSSGGVVAKGDPEALASSIMRFAEQRRLLAQTVRSTVVENFSLAHMVSKTERLFRESIG